MTDVYTLVSNSSAPTGIAVDEEGLSYIVEWLAHRVKVVKKDGSIVRTWGTFGSGPGQLNGPYGIAVSGDEVYVSDEGNQRVQVFRPDGTFVRAMGEGLLQAPRYVAIDSQAKQRASFARLRLLCSHGRATASPLFEIVFGDADLNVFSIIFRMVCGNNDDDRVFVTDRDSHQCQIFRKKDGAFVSSWGTNKESDKPGDFNQPAGVAVNGDLVYITESYGNRVQVFRKDGELVRTFGKEGVGKGQFQGAHGIAVDGQHVFVSDCYNDRVQAFDKCGLFIKAWESRGKFCQPRGLSARGGRVVIADTKNNRAQVLRAPLPTPKSSPQFAPLPSPCQTIFARLLADLTKG